MPTPVISQSVDPSDPTTQLSGQAQRPADLNVTLNSLNERLTKLEHAVNGFHPLFALSGAMPALTFSSAAIIYQSFTIDNPSGADVIVIGGFSCYATVSGQMEQYYSIDGDDWSTHFAMPYFFNTTGDHRWCGTWVRMVTFTPGDHFLGLIGKAATGAMLSNTNDSYTFAAIEL